MNGIEGSKHLTTAGLGRNWDLNITIQDESNNGETTPSYWTTDGREEGINTIVICFTDVAATRLRKSQTKLIWYIGSVVGRTVYAFLGLSPKWLYGSPNFRPILGDGLRASSTTWPKKMPYNLKISIFYRI
jgi:hypothetical protein